MPPDEEYKDYATPWNRKCLERPYVVFAPATEQDAAAVIREINKVREEFVISSGGHDYECQSATKHALLSTKLFKGVKLDT